MARSRLEGGLAVPERPVGLLLVLVRTREERKDPLRVRFADFLHHCRFATLMVSLAAEGDAAAEPDLELLAGRVRAGVEWAGEHPRLEGLAIGLLADGEAVAPALVAAAHLADRVAALVALGGRPDLARGALRGVVAPTLLAAPELGEEELASARGAAAMMSCPVEVAIVEGAAHLLAEEDAAGGAALLARAWFQEHLGQAVG